MTEQQRLDLGLVDSIEARALGEPGQRTFHLHAVSARGQATVWMEKEQLLQLALAIRRLAGPVAPESPDAYVPEYAHSGDPVAVEFKAGDMRLRYDGGADVFTVEATSSGGDEEGEEPAQAAAVQFAFRRSAAEALAGEASRIVAAGRSLCPYCHAPMDPGGHICPKSNGHHKAGLAAE